MSGTSVDGIDAGLVDFSGGKVRLVDFIYQPFSSEFRQTIQGISQPGQPVLLKNFGILDARLGQLFAEAALALLDKAGISATEIQGIGSHGQTVYHAPDPAFGFSLQIGDPNRIAQITGITTVADFRRRDMATGGQGAPLVPAFHQAVFAAKDQTRTVVNIGGIANITVLDGNKVIGFDTGPGNTLLDFWYQQHHCDTAFDPCGDWAARGRVEPALLTTFKDDDYFRLSPPKSTGKEYFSPAWLQQKLSLYKHLKAEDIQATLAQLSADSISDAISRYAPGTEQILVCGGGVHNRQLLKLLQQNLDSPVISTIELGIDPDHVEACAFAWLARQTLNNLPGNLCSVTGAQSPVVLGGIYLGKNRNLR